MAPSGARWSRTFPAVVLHFIGRRFEVAAVCSLLARRRACYADRPAASARPVSPSRRRASSPGILPTALFVDLSATADARLVASTIAGSLELMGQPGKPIGRRSCPSSGAADSPRPGQLRAGTEAAPLVAGLMRAETGCESSSQPHATPSRRRAHVRRPSARPGRRHDGTRSHAVVDPGSRLTAEN